MTVPRSALVTYAGLPGLDAGDRLAAQHLARLGVEAVPAVWDDPAVDWATFQAVVLRSTWDYHLKPDAFRCWLDRLDAAGVRLWNSAPLVRWNMDKRYLHELQTRGAAVVPTVWLEPGNRADLETLLAEQGWARAVVKPAISASAHDTWTTSPGTAAQDQPRLVAMLARGGVLVQRFMPQVNGEGEWSLVFFRGEYSHALQKRAAEGDFRVQVEHGGSTVRAEADPALIAGARAVLDCVTSDWLYVRVDGVAEAGRFVLMELELIEPQLLLAGDDDAAARFAAAVRGVLDV